MSKPSEVKDDNKPSLVEQPDGKNGKTVTKKNQGKGTETVAKPSEVQDDSKSLLVEERDSKIKNGKTGTKNYHGKGPEKFNMDKPGSDKKRTKINN